MKLLKPISAMVKLYKGFSKSERRMFLGILFCIMCTAALVIFEPFSPYYAFGVFALLIVIMVLSVKIFHSKGIPFIPAVKGWLLKHKLKVASALILTVLLWSVILFLPMGRSPFSGLSENELSEKIGSDYVELKQSIFKMDNVIRGFHKNRSLFDISKLEDISTEDRARVLSMWAEFMEHIILYDNLVSQYRFFYRIPPFSQPHLHNRAYLTGYTAFISRYLYAWELLSTIRDNEIWEKILNEKSRGYGFPEGSYTKVKEKVTNPNEVARLTAGYAHLNFLRTRMDEKFQVREGEVFTYVDDCFLKCAGNLALKSVVWAPKNSLDAFKDKTYDIWFPFQKGAAGATGHIRLTARKKNYIKSTHLEEFRKHLQPGDILVERRNWYLSNVGIPGFWPHAALYTGTREEFLAFFSGDLQIRNLLQDESIEQYLEERYPLCWKDLKEDRCIIEAIAPGVVLNTLEKSAGADYAASMRPLLSRKDVFLALCAAFSHYRKPYDYNFDFVTDSELVCTELVYKSYRTTEHKKGITFPLIQHAGRDLCTAQVFVRTFDEQYDTAEKQLEFGAFLDYDPEKRKIVEGSLQDFRDSWTRAKWSVLLE